MREARFHTKVIALHLALAGLVAAGCAAKAPLKATPDEIVSIKRGTDVRLINEGGPVFALPGEVVLPAFFTANTDGMTLTAERVDGSKIQSVPASRLHEDGTFELTGPVSAGIFFATTVVNDQDALYRMQALVRPEEGRMAIVKIDSVSTLVAAKISLASKRHQMAELGAMYDRTTQLQDHIRQAVPEHELRQIPLDGESDSLAAWLQAVAGARPDLDYELHAWEEALHGERKAGTDVQTLPPPASQPIPGEPPK